MNKKGEGSKYLSIWWFLVLVFVGVSLFIGAWMYFGVGVNVKAVDSLALEESLADCLLNDGGFLSFNFNSFVFENKEFDVFKECDLNKNLFFLETPFYFEVGITDEKGKEIKILKEGDYSYRIDCVIAGDLEARHFPVCASYTYPFLYVTEGKTFVGKMRILAASDQDGGVDNE